MNEEQLQRALNNCHFFLKFRPRSKEEMVNYLNKMVKRFKWDQEIVDKTINSLKKQKLIDDKKFIDWYVNIKQKSKGKSQRVLQLELKRLGLDQFLMEDFFQDNAINEEEEARSALGVRWSKWAALDKRKRFEKAAKFLMNRGFNYSLSKKLVAEFEERE